jgi:hypothetical protein
MSPIERVYEALERADCRPRGNPGSQRQIEARCPAHDDRNASLSFSEGDDGKVLIKCFKGCTTTDIVHALQLGLEDLFPERVESRVPEHPARIVAEYVYRDEAGEPLIKVVRYDPKSFRQMRWEGGRWQWGLGDVRRVLYRLPEVTAALERGEVVFVVEGEKDADALVRAGHCATTPMMGAGKWRPEYTEQLTGAANRIVVIGDDDKPDPKTGRREGHLHALAVWRALQGRVGQVIARLPAEGFKDVADQLAAGVPFTSRTLRPIPALLEAVAAPAAPDENGALMLTARAMSARPAPERALQVVGPLIQRGMRTTVGAETGNGKTTLALQAIRCLVHREPFLDEAWVPPRPGKALIVDLEQGEETVKARLREAGLADSDAVDVLWQPAGLALDSEAADQTLLYDTLRRGRYDLVLLDPLYQMHRGNANDERTAADLMRIVDGWSRELNFAVVIPMHARKPHPQAGKAFTINDIAGSTGWNRNAEFVMGIQVMSAGASRLHFFKDRIGLGPEVGKHWWLKFDRARGFERTHQEDRQAVRAVLKGLLATPEGVTEAELLKAAAGDEVAVKALLKKAHVNRDGRWREADWNEQQTLSTDDQMT